MAGIPVASPVRLAAADGSSTGSNPEQLPDGPGPPPSTSSPAPPEPQAAALCQPELPDAGAAQVPTPAAPPELSHQQISFGASASEALSGLRSLLPRVSSPRDLGSSLIHAGSHITASWQRAGRKGISPSASGVFGSLQDPAQAGNAAKVFTDAFGARGGPHSRSGSPQARGMRSHLWPRPSWSLSNSSLAAGFVGASFLMAALASVFSSWLLCRRDPHDVTVVHHSMTPFEARVAQAGMGLGTVDVPTQHLSNSEVKQTHRHRLRSSDKWWVDRLADSGQWKVHPDYKGVPGAVLAVGSPSFACILVLPRVCHFWALGGKSPSGHWYSLKGADLPRLVSAEDACGHRSRAIPPPFSKKRISSVKEATEKMGSFLSEQELGRFLKAAKITVVDSTGPDPTPLKKRQVVRHRRRARAVLAPHDSFLGHFVERVGSLAELSAALDGSLEGRGGHLLEDLSMQLGGGLDSVMLFANDAQVSHFAGNVSQLVFGPQSQLSFLPGRGRKFSSHECFEEAIFPLNVVHTSKSITAFKRRIESWLQDPTLATEEEPQRPLQTPPQVTWLWRGNRRTILNSGDVMNLLMETWKLPVRVAEFSDQSNFRDIVATMHSSVLVLGMHGSGLANMIFMKDDTGFLEIIPFMYRYHPFMVLAKAYGLQAWQWKNLKRKNALFDNNCFNDKKWGRFSVTDCWQDKACLRCVRDHAETVIDPDLFKSTLEVIREAILKTTNFSTS